MEGITWESFGNNAKVLKAVTFAQNLAVTKAPILIVGEKGVGKKEMAKKIHESSSRHLKSFIVVDCARSAAEVENEILGFREEDSGRFIKGALERANGSTLVLSNIDELEEEFQKKLYKIISELGDYDLDVRILATTAKNLSKLVANMRFNRSLFNFIAANQVFIPPLRERIEDIPVLARSFITEKEIDISADAIQKLVTHYWTHNVEELKSVIENSLSNNEDQIIDINDLEFGEKKAISLLSEKEDDGIKLMSLKDAECLLIKKALIHTSENRTQAAKILGVSIRTLRNKINEYRVDGNNYFMNLR